MAVLETFTPIVVEPDTLKQWTVDEYHQMSQLGILSAAERTELIAGHIIVMAAKGTPHVVALQLIATQLDAFLATRSAFVRTQDPIVIDALSEPEPDLVIVKGAILDYTKHHPQPSDVLLIVEVSDSTLKQDCTVKDKLYARAGIVEYWVQDLKNQQMHIFTEPMPSGYGSHLILRSPNQISPLAFPDCVISLASIFPPA